MEKKGVLLSAETHEAAVEVKKKLQAAKGGRRTTLDEAISHAFLKAKELEAREEAEAAAIVLPKSGEKTETVRVHAGSDPWAARSKSLQELTGNMVKLDWDEIDDWCASFRIGGAWKGTQTRVRVKSKGRRDLAAL